mmetsp:Transcript_17281/g.19992  ORF Transcript_17281/g.19992 Transcript_17281/m.19992 type:complete len:431 (+) Transcript_17281:34-1326(+)
MEKTDTNNNNFPSYSTFGKKERPAMEQVITRTPSVAYRQGTKEAIQKVLEEVELQAANRVKDGFSEVNFTLGVLNCFFVLFMFNVYPENFWIVYIFEALFLFPAKFRFMIRAKPLNQAFYYLDFCWCMNFLCVIGLLALFAAKDQIPDEVRKHLFLAGYGAACGPLLTATISLPFVSLVFHHLESITSVFIHFYPPLMFYILRWNADEVKETWPGSFNLDYEVVFWPSKDGFMGTVYGNTFILYMLWYVPYLLWQLFIGLDLPRAARRKKLKDGTPAPAVYDTVFHANMRNGLCLDIGKKIWKRPKELSMEQIKTNHFEIRDFALYMSWHFIAANLSMIMLAYPCYLSKYVHAFLLWFMAVICTYRGAIRYTYYSTKMYGRIIRKQFENEIQCSEESKKLVDNSSMQEDTFTDNASIQSFRITPSTSKED